MDFNLKNIIRLPSRLKALLEYIDEGAAVADIGTDHGILPVYLAQNGLTRRVIASDISAGSLDAARRNADKYMVSEKISFINAPGLDGISHTDVDTIVVAGLGGETIVSIIDEAPWIKHRDIKLIFQPQSKKDILFRYLYNNKFTIINTKIVSDRGKPYTIINCGFTSTN
jgi:tRNA (adenine22-N1)-methyltransferase